MTNEKIIEIIDKYYIYKEKDIKEKKILDKVIHKNSTNKTYLEKIIPNVNDKKNNTYIMDIMNEEKIKEYIYDICFFGEVNINEKTKKEIKELIKIEVKNMYGDLSDTKIRKEKIQLVEKGLFNDFLDQKQKIVIKNLIKNIDESKINEYISEIIKNNIEIIKKNIEKYGNKKELNKSEKIDEIIELIRISDISEKEVTEMLNKEDFNLTFNNIYEKILTKEKLNNDSIVFLMSQNLKIKNKYLEYLKYNKFNDFKEDIKEKDFIEYFCNLQDDDFSNFDNVFSNYEIKKQEKKIKFKTKDINAENYIIDEILKIKNNLEKEKILNNLKEYKEDLINKNKDPEKYFDLLQKILIEKQLFISNLYTKKTFELIKEENILNIKKEFEEMIEKEKIENLSLRTFLKTKKYKKNIDYKSNYNNYNLLFEDLDIDKFNKIKSFFENNKLTFNEQEEVINKINKITNREGIIFLLSGEYLSKNQKTTSVEDLYKTIDLIDKLDLIFSKNLDHNTTNTIYKKIFENFDLLELNNEKLKEIRTLVTSFRINIQEQNKNMSSEELSIEKFDKYLKEIKDKSITPSEKTISMLLADLQINYSESDIYEKDIQNTISKFGNTIKQLNTSGIVFSAEDKYILLEEYYKNLMNYAYNNSDEKIKELFKVNKEDTIKKFLSDSLNKIEEIEKDKSISVEEKSIKEQNIKNIQNIQENVTKKYIDNVFFQQYMDKYVLENTIDKTDYILGKEDTQYFSINNEFYKVNKNNNTNKLDISKIEENSIEDIIKEDNKVKELDKDIVYNIFDDKYLIFEKNELKESSKKIFDEQSKKILINNLNISKKNMEIYQVIKEDSKKIIETSIYNIDHISILNSINNNSNKIFGEKIQDLIRTTSKEELINHSSGLRFDTIAYILLKEDIIKSGKRNISYYKNNIQILDNYRKNNTTLDDIMTNLKKNKTSVAENKKLLMAYLIDDKLLDENIKEEIKNMISDEKITEVEIIRKLNELKDPNIQAKKIIKELKQNGVEIKDEKKLMDSFTQYLINGKTTKLMRYYNYSSYESLIKQLENKEDNRNFEDIIKDINNKKDFLTFNDNVLKKKMDIVTNEIYYHYDNIQEQISGKIPLQNEKTKSYYNGSFLKESLNRKDIREEDFSPDYVDDIKEKERLKKLKTFDDEWSTGYKSFRRVSNLWNSSEVKELSTADSIINFYNEELNVISGFSTGKKLINTLILKGGVRAIPALYRGTTGVLSSTINYFTDYNRDRTKDGFNLSSLNGMKDMFVKNMGGENNFVKILNDARKKHNEEIINRMDKGKKTLTNILKYQSSETKIKTLENVLDKINKNVNIESLESNDVKFTYGLFESNEVTKKIKEKYKELYGVVLSEYYELLKKDGNAFQQKGKYVSTSQNIFKLFKIEDKVNAYISSNRILKPNSLKTFIDEKEITRINNLYGMSFNKKDIESIILKSIEYGRESKKHPTEEKQLHENQKRSFLNINYPQQVKKTPEKIKLLFNDLSDTNKDEQTIIKELKELTTNSDGYNIIINEIIDNSIPYLNDKNDLYIRKDIKQFYGKKNNDYTMIEPHDKDNYFKIKPINFNFISKLDLKNNEENQKIISKLINQYPMLKKEIIEQIRDVEVISKILEQSSLNIFDYKKKDIEKYSFTNYKFFSKNNAILFEYIKNENNISEKNKKITKLEETSLFENNKDKIINSAYVQFQYKEHNFIDYSTKKDLLNKLNVKLYDIETELNMASLQEMPIEYFDVYAYERIIKSFINNIEKINIFENNKEIKNQNDSLSTENINVETILENFDTMSKIDNILELIDIEKKIKNQNLLISKLKNSSDYVFMKERLDTIEAKIDKIKKNELEKNYELIISDFLLKPEIQNKNTIDLKFIENNVYLQKYPELLRELKENKLIEKYFNKINGRSESNIKDSIKKLILEEDNKRNTSDKYKDLIKLIESNEKELDLSRKDEITKELLKLLEILISNISEEELKKINIDINNITLKDFKVIKDNLNNFKQIENFEEYQILEKLYLKNINFRNQLEGKYSNTKSETEEEKSFNKNVKEKTTKIQEKISNVSNFMSEINKSDPFQKGKNLLQNITQGIL